MMDEKVTINVRGLGLIGLLGGLGGAINAWLCYARIPVPVMTEGFMDSRRQPFDFPCSVIPGGACHGGLLALISVALAALLWQRGWLTRLTGLAVAGWLAGWLSYIPLGLSMDETVSGKQMVEALVWPFERPPQSLLVPYFYFGLVGSAYYLFLNLCRQLTRQQLGLHLFIGSLSGILGSLWWWVGFKPWYFSLLHGTIWGCLVGFGVWKSQQSPKTSR